MSKDIVYCNRIEDDKGFYVDNYKVTLRDQANNNLFISQILCFFCIIFLLITIFYTAKSDPHVNGASITLGIITFICFATSMYNLYYYQYNTEVSSYKNGSNSDGIPVLPCVNKDGTISNLDKSIFI